VFYLLKAYVTTVAIVDTNIVNVAVPAMHATLGASGAGLQLIVAGYTIAYAVLLITGARLGDILGHRRVYLAGVALFTLASLGCGLAPSTGVLVALRFVQGAGAATMIPQVLSLIQRSYTSPGPRARAMSLYATVISGGSVLGQVIGGLLVSANLFGSSWRPVFLVNVPVGLAVLACGRLLPAKRHSEGVRLLDLPGLAVLTPAVLAFVLPLVLGQPLGWPAWGWALLAGSVVLFALLGLVESRAAARGGQPILPRSLLGLPGMTAGLGGLFVAMAVFGGWLFSLALQLQDGRGDSPLRAGLTFVPAGVAFALVSLNWRRLPARFHGGLVIAGFLVTGAGLLWSGLLFRSGGDGGVWLYLALAVAGGGMAAAFGALMGRVVSGVPVALAADASGVMVTVNQLGIVTGIALFGSLFLNRAGQLPVGGHEAGAFALSAGHAYLLVAVALAVLALAGAVLAAVHGRAAARLSVGSLG
jgi:MFS family permease